MTAKKSTKKSALRIPWPFAPKMIGTNADTDLLKLVAMVTMLIDHVGKVCFPNYYIMRIIGRMAFPIYAYCIAVGCVYTRNHVKYLSRLVLFGLISQPLYVAAFWPDSVSAYIARFSQNPVDAIAGFYMFSWTRQSTLLALTMGVLVIWTIRERKIILTAALALAVWKMSARLDYGWKGVTLMVLMYMFIRYWWLSLPVVLSFMVWWGMQGTGYELFGIRFGTQMFALLSLPLIYIPTYSRVRVNKWIFYLYYPAHLILVIFMDRMWF